MKTLYLDLASGISGDMLVGALLDLGADLVALERGLAELKLGGYHLHAHREKQDLIDGVKFDVHLESDEAPVSTPPAKPHASTAPGHHPHRHAHPHTHHPDRAHSDTHGRTFADIRHLIHDSGLSHWVKHRAIAVFTRIAEAEGKVHGQPPDTVHFHEVGAIDSIVDIVGACLALEQLGQPRVLATPVVDGTGWVDCAHGRLPIPVPATLEILSARRVPVSQCDEPVELVTPTGAALLAEFVEEFGPLRDFIPSRVGYGLGTRATRGRPNVLRVVQGEPAAGANVAASSSLDWEADVIAKIETNLDDLPAEILGRFVELALARGALDVFFTPVHMKKNRPGTLLTVLCREAEADVFSELILRETSAFGVRRCTSERRKLRRESVETPTPYGPVWVKIGRLNGRIVQVAPEFESCKNAAEASGAPLRRVYDAALRATPLD